MPMKATKSTLHVVEGDPTEAARAAKETTILKAEEGQRKRIEAQESQSKAQADQKKQQACKIAKYRYFAIKDAGVLYKVDEQGNRQYYSDTDGDARKEQARQAMTAACGQ